MLYLNGLDAATGRPLVDPVSYDDLARRVLAIYAPEQRRAERAMYEATRSAPFDEYHLDDPAQAGWGLLDHADEAEVMQDRLAALIAHRRCRSLGRRRWRWAALGFFALALGSYEQALVVRLLVVSVDLARGAFVPVRRPPLAAIADAIWWLGPLAAYFAVRWSIFGRLIGGYADSVRRLTEIDLAVRVPEALRGLAYLVCSTD